MGRKGRAGGGDDRALRPNNLLEQLAFKRLRLPRARRRKPALKQWNASIEARTRLGSRGWKTAVAAAEVVDIGAADYP